MESSTKDQAKGKFHKVTGKPQCCRNFPIRTWVNRSERVRGEPFANKAREGVKVRILYDWMGALGKTSRPFWRTLKEAGANSRTKHADSQ